MKRFFSFLLIITFASHFGTTETFAQKRTKSREVIIVVFSHSTDDSFDELEFPINKTAKGKLDAGGGMVSECGFTDSRCGDFVYSSYEISGRAFAVSKNRARIKLKGEVTVGYEDCKINGTYAIYRNRKTKIRLGSCGASFVAYYGFKRKEAN